MHRQDLFEKLEEAETFIFVNTIQHPHTLKNNIYHSNKQGRPPVFHSDTNPVLGHVLVYSVDKTHVLIVAVELIWLLFLNILSFNFVPTPNKSLWFTRFRRTYVSRPVVRIKVAVLFCLICAGQSGYVSFLAAVCPQWQCICLTYFCYAHLLLEFR